MWLHYFCFETRFKCNNCMWWIIKFLKTTEIGTTSTENYDIDWFLSSSMLNIKVNIDAILSTILRSFDIWSSWTFEFRRPTMAKVPYLGRTWLFRVGLNQIYHPLGSFVLLSHNRFTVVFTVQYERNNIAKYNFEDQFSWIMNEMTPSG